MNSKALKDYLAAASACAPGASLAGPLELAAAVAEAASGVEWEIGVCGADASVLRLALRPPAGSDGALAAEAAQVLGPGLEAVWNSETARWRRVGPARGKPLAARRFSPAIFEEPVASALEAFDTLAPIAAVRFSADRPGWTLILASPPAWPSFLRCDVAASFAPRAAELSLLLRGARVRSLDFDGVALWATLAG